MAKNQSSKSTDRAARNAKNGKTRGAVRVHTKKTTTAPPKQGEDLLSQLQLERRGKNGIRQVAGNRSTARKPFVRDAATAAKLVSNDAGPKLVAKAKNDDWCQEAKIMAQAYMRSLIHGDGSKPAGMSSTLSRIVEQLFGDACNEQRIGWDTLPGQTADFYIRRTAKARARQTERRLATAS